MQALDLYRAIQAAAAAAPTADQMAADIGARCWAKSQGPSLWTRALEYWATVETGSAADWTRDAAHDETLGELLDLAAPLLASKHATFKHASGRVKLVNTRERLQAFAADMLKGSAWALWGGGAKPAETVKPRKARAHTWRPGLVKVAAEALQDGQAADFLAVAMDQLGGRAFMIKANEAFVLYAADYAEGLPEGFAVARRCDGKWCTTHMPSGLGVGYAFKSKAQTLESGRSALQNTTPEKLARALEAARTVTEEQHAEALAAWRAAHGLDQVAPETEAQAEELAIETDHTTEAAPMSEDMAAIVATAAAVAIGTAQAQAAETCAPGATDPRAYVAAAAVDLERLTNSFNYDSTRRAKIEAGRRGELGALSYIVETLQRLAAQPGHSIGAMEARKTLQRLADEVAEDAQAMSDQAHQQCGETQARTVRARVELLQILATLPETDAAEDAAELVTCDGPEVAEAAAAVADTPAAPVDAIGATDTPAETDPADYTQAPETLAQAGGYTQAPETLRADYLRAADAGHTQQAGSKTGAWSAVMFRTEAGRAGLAFKRPGHPVELIDCATGGERMRALQAMAQAAEQAHRQQLAADTPAAPAAPAADCTQAPETLATDCTAPLETLEQSRYIPQGPTADDLARHGENFTPEQCEQVARSMEHDNNHGGALMWRCMGARAFDLAARAAANTQAHDRAGHLTDELAAQRQAIADELRARRLAAPGCTQAPETLAADDEAKKFQRARPQHIDLRHFLADGVKPAQLVGLGVHYTGDMANAAGEGAIVEAHADDASGLRVTVTLEDGRHMTHLNGYSFADRPGSRFALNAKVHGAPYLAELAAARAALVASTEAAKTSKAQHHAAELVRLAAEFPHLQRKGPNDRGGVFAARNIRTMLKAAFPGVKFSVTSDYSSVRVRWTDGPTDAQVKAVTNRFNIGRADYNTDYFYTTSSAWSDLFGGVQYLFTNRDESPELLARVLDAYNAKHGTQATPEDWRKQAGPFSYTSRDGDAHRHWFRDMLTQTDATPPAKASRGAKA